MSGTPDAPGAPQVPATVDGPELVWRPLTAADAPTLFALLSASEAADEAPFRTGPEEAEQYLADPEVDLSADSVAAILA